jgi:hypothetical protein
VLLGHRRSFAEFLRPQHAGNRRRAAAENDEIEAAVLFHSCFRVVRVQEAAVILAFSSAVAVAKSHLTGLQSPHLEASKEVRIQMAGHSHSSSGMV